MLVESLSHVLHRDLLRRVLLGFMYGQMPEQISPTDVFIISSVLEGLGQDDYNEVQR